MHILGLDLFTGNGRLVSIRRKTLHKTLSFLRECHTWLLPALKQRHLCAQGEGQKCRKAGRRAKSPPVELGCGTWGFQISSQRNPGGQGRHLRGEIKIDDGRKCYCPINQDDSLRAHHACRRSPCRLERWWWWWWWARGQAPNELPLSVDDGTVTDLLSLIYFRNSAGRGPPAVIEAE